MRSATYSAIRSCWRCARSAWAIAEAAIAVTSVMDTDATPMATMKRREMEDMGTRR